MNVQFEAICSYVEKHSIDEMMFNGLLRFFSISEEQAKKIELETLKNRYINEEFKELPSDIKYFEECITDIKLNLEKYKWIYEEVIEEDSKEIFINLLSAKVYMSANMLEQAYTEDLCYFDRSIFHYNKGEVYVDCGGYIGDTTLQFIKQSPDFKKIYIYEANPNIVLKCRDRLKYFIEEESIVITEKVVYDRENILRVALQHETGDSHVDLNGEIIVEACSLDRDIKEPISFIKMDIEGSEKEAILGAKEHIINDVPKMAICIYHLPDDFWRIPELIISINPKYKFKIRQHSSDVFAETVLYCIPQEENRKQEETVDEVKIAQRCKAVLECTDIYFVDQITNIATTVKDKKWFLNQLRTKQIYINAKEDELEWLQKQNSELLEATKVRDQSVEELKKYIDELLEGKEWLETQNRHLLEIQEERMKYINELLQGKEWLEAQNKQLLEVQQEHREYINELLQGKGWREKQHKQLVEDKDWLENELKESQQYVNDLLVAKLWLEDENNKLQDGNRAIQEKMIELEQQYEESRNLCAKTQYKLNKLYEDKLIKRLIKIKKL